PDEDGDAIAELERRQIIVVEGASRPPLVHCAHPLFREGVEAGLTPVARRRIASTLSERVAASGAASPQVSSRVALWRLDAGLPVDPDELVDAARRARAADRIRLGIRYARAAHDLRPDATSAL